MAPMGDEYAGFHTTYQMNVQRGLGGNGSVDASQLASPSQSNTLQCLALAFSTISVASAILAFYWFIKMRRSFRHDLIMLLIQSDMFKALWLMLYPIVTFSYGPVPNAAKFCQVQGFFVSLGIEASDFAILMIAMHTALYIFKPRTSPSESGLYPYRHIAYVLWVIFPILAASLAFVNEGDSYVTDGTYCYLPVRPFWYQLALAWIPRYIIFIVILGIYVSIYYYVRYKFHSFSREGDGSDSSKETMDKTPRATKRSSLPRVPELAYHGLIPDSRESSVTEPPQRTANNNLRRQKSVSSPHSEAHRFIWTSFISQSDSPVQPLTPPPTPPSESSTLVADSPSSGQPQHATTVSFGTPLNLPSGDSSIEPSHPSHQLSLPDKHNNGSQSHTSRILHPKSVFRRKPKSTQAPAPISQLALVNSRGQNLAVSEMIRTREKIRRQLRFLFIYPLVYMAMWLVPFVSHILQYDDRFATNPPFPLNCVTTIFVASQAAVDCWLFSTREKPWRHIPGNENTHSFWGSLKFWSGWEEIRARRKQATQPGPGKTRQEMAREARQAYRRRDKEMAERRTDSGHMELGHAKREWWEGRATDSAGDPTMMTPVAEESNPMDDAVVPGLESVLRSETLSAERGTEREGGEENQEENNP